MLFNVYIWLGPDSPYAEICETFAGEEAQEAAFAAMRLYQVPYAFYVWAAQVTLLDGQPDQSFDFHHLECLDVPAHMGSEVRHGS